MLGGNLNTVEANTEIPATVSKSGNVWKVYVSRSGQLSRSTDFVVTFAQFVYFMKRIQLCYSWKPCLLCLKIERSLGKEGRWWVKLVFILTMSFVFCNSKQRVFSKQGKLLVLCSYIGMYKNSKINKPKLKYDIYKNIFRIKLYLQVN